MILLRTLCFAVLTMAIPQDIQEVEAIDVGDRLISFAVYKAAGPDSDGVAIGDPTCYVCASAGRPLVIAFVTAQGKNKSSVARMLDELAAKQTDRQLQAFVAVVGKRDRQMLMKQLKEFAANEDIVRIPIVVPEECESGPQSYAFDANKHESLILFALQGHVVQKFALTPEEIDAEGLSAVRERIERQLVR